MSAANYLDNWKCFAVLKGDGSNLQQSLAAPPAGDEGRQGQQQVASSFGSSGGNAARYLSLGPITSAQQVPWH